MIGVDLSSVAFCVARQSARGFLLPVAVLAFLPSCSANEPGPSLLFGPGEARLGPDAQRQIAAAFGETFPLSADGATFSDPNCGDVMPIADVVDLNGDDDYEVFVAWGNACTSGGAGRSLTLFSRHADGKYRTQLGFPALGWTALASDSQGWPDLSFGGPGFCHAVWSWREDGYAFKCNLAETDGGCESRGNTC